MRGGNTDSTVVVGRRADRSTAGRVAARGRRSRCTTSTGSRSTPSCAPAALVLVNDATFTHAQIRDDVHVDARAGHRRRRPMLGNPLGGAMVMARRVRRAHRARRARRADRRDARVDPAVPHAAHRGERDARSAPVADSCPGGRSTRPGRAERRRMTDATRSIKSRGTVTIDVEHCKGCELCIPACPPGVLTMSTRGEPHGLPLPRAASRAAPAARRASRVPRLRVRGVPVRRTDRDRGGGRAVTATAPLPATAC